MADELTPDERRQLGAIDRALSGRPVDPDFDDIARLTSQLREERQTPAPEFIRELDRRAAGWIAGAEPAGRRRSWWRITVPALATGAAAAVVAVAVIGGGDDGSESELALTATREQPRAGALAAPEAAPEEDHAHEESTGPLPGKELELKRASVRAGQPLLVRYEVFSTVQAKVDFAGRSGEVTLDPGIGTLEIGTDGVDPGSRPLSIVLQPGGSLHTDVRVRN